MKQVTEYLHVSKDSIYERDDLTDAEKDALIGALYEVQFLVDLDTCHIVAVDGISLVREGEDR